MKVALSGEISKNIRLRKESIEADVSRGGGPEGDIFGISSGRPEGVRVSKRKSSKGEPNFSQSNAVARAVCFRFVGRVSYRTQKFELVSVLYLLLLFLFSCDKGNLKFFKFTPRFLLRFVNLSIW